MGGRNCDENQYIPLHSTVMTALSSNPSRSLIQILLKTPRQMHYSSFSYHNLSLLPCTNSTPFTHAPSLTLLVKIDDISIDCEVEFIVEYSHALAELTRSGLCNRDSVGERVRTSGNQLLEVVYGNRFRSAHRPTCSLQWTRSTHNHIKLL